MIKEEVLYEYNDDDTVTVWTLSKPFTEFDMLRFYCGWQDSDGLFITEIPTWRFVTDTGVMNVHLFYNGGATVGGMGSERFYILRKGQAASTSTTQLGFYRAKLTYLNNGTTNYSNRTFSDSWVKSPVRKIVGIKFNG